MGAININKTATTLIVESTETLTATVLPANATNQTVTWTSNNPAIASVQNGIITAVAQGIATITAKAGSYTATCEVTVGEKGEAVATASLKKFPLEDGKENVYYGNVGVNLALNHQGKTYSDVKALKIELFNGNTLLATNALRVFESTGNTIDSPFLVGRTEVNAQYAWVRGVYPTNAYVPTSEELPTKVVATYTIDGKIYVSESNVSIAAPDRAVKTSADLKAAIANEKRKEVVLGDNIDLGSEGLVVSTTKILDLAGYTISHTNQEKEDALTINGDGNLTINDTKGNGGITTLDGGASNYPLAAKDNAKLTINGGTYSGQYYAIALWNESTVTINDGTFNGNIANNGADTGEELKLNINGGTINGGLYLPAEHGVTKITNGDIISFLAIQINAGKLDISGGTITGNTDTSTQNHYDQTVRTGGNGYFTGALVAAKPSTSKEGSYGSAVEVNISGGTITNDLGDAIVLVNQATTHVEGITEITVNITGGTVNGDIRNYDKDEATPSVLNVDEAATINGLLPGQAKVTNKEELEAALLNNKVTEIIVSGTLGSESAYTVYNVNRDYVTIQGADGAKVYGTFIVKADGVTIDSLAIQNKGDLDGESSTNRGGIYVYAKNVTLTNNTITNGLGNNPGLSNAIQIMSPTADNSLSNYVITGNKLIGHIQGVPNWSSSGIVIAQGYKPGSIGGAKAETITASTENYQNLLNNNTFTNNKIDLTHQDWSKTGDEVVLYPVPVDEE